MFPLLPLYVQLSSNIKSIVNPATTLNVTSVPLPATDQEAELQLVQAQNAPPVTPTTGATADLSRISVTTVDIKDGTNFDTGETGIYVDITFTFDGVNAGDSSTHLGDSYQLGTVSIEPKNSTSNYSVILFSDEITLDGDSPTQIVRNVVFFADNSITPATDLTEAEVTIELGELVKMERGKGEIKAIIRNVTTNNSDKYGRPLEA